MSLDDIPCVCVFNGKAAKKSKVRPFDKCQCCQHAKICQKEVNEPHPSSYFPDLYGPGKSTYHCREPKGIPLFTNNCCDSTDFYSLNDIKVSANGVQFRINDYPSLCEVDVRDHKISAGWIGLDIDINQAFQEVRYVKFEHFKGFRGYSGKQPEILRVYYRATTRSLFGKTTADYIYTVIMDWDQKIMYAELYDGNEKIATSRPKSLQNL